MTEQLKQAEQRLDEFLSQFDEAEQERILRHAIDHVVPRLKSRALTTSQPGATNEATTQAQDDSSSDAQVDQVRLRDADSRVGAQVPALTQPAQAVPMTDEQVDRIWNALPMGDGFWLSFARSIEAHHGITAQGAQGGEAK